MILLALFLAAEPSSQPTFAKDTITYTSLVGARVNPLGAAWQFRVAYRRCFFDSESPLFKPANVSAGIVGSVTPAFVRIGPSVEVMPLAVLQLNVSYEVVSYFGVLSNVLAYSSPLDDASDRERSRLAQLGANRPLTGGLLTLSALLQGKVGPIAIRAQLQIFRMDMPGRPGETVWYDPMTDLLAPLHGFYLTNDSDVLYMTSFGLVAGARHSLAYAIYDQPFAGLLQHRVGPLLLYEFFNRPGAAFDKPSLVLMAQWHLQHRYRTGQEITQALPQITLAFLFQGDLWRR